MSISRQYFWPLFLPLLVFAFPLSANEEPKYPMFTVQTTSGSPVKGKWRQLKSDWSVRLGEGDGSLVPGANVLSVRRVDEVMPPLPREDYLLLANGDCVPFRNLRLVEEKIHFGHVSLEGGKDASLPLSAVSVLWYAAPDKELDAEKLRHRLATGTRTHDTVCLRNGDQLIGILTSLDAANATVEVEKRRVTVKTPQLAYIAFNTELIVPLRPKGPHGRLVLCDKRPGRGGRMTLTTASADETTLTGTTVFGASLRVPLRDVAALDVHQGHFVYLSDLKEKKYVFEPFLDAAWPFVADGNVAGHDLRLAGSTYDKGISMHSRSRLTYRLSGPYQRFEAVVGLDDRDGHGGAVSVRVSADGRALWERSISDRDGAVPVSLSVKGAHELTLEVDFGRDGDVCDVVDWGDARLVK